MSRVVLKALPLAAALAVAGTAALAQAPPPGPPLPDGPAKALVEQKCAVCHDIGRITFSGYDRPGWDGVVARMKNLGAQLTAAESDQVAAYLAAHFPDRRPPAVILPGPVRVTFKEWKVPTPGSRPHDPLATPDGALWYAGQMAIPTAHSNVVSRAHAGKSPLQLIHARLALEASRSLVYSSMTIGEISDALGFSEPAHFTRFFRKAAGKSPREFRQQAWDAGSIGPKADAP